MLLTDYDIECLEQARAILDNHKTVHQRIGDIAHTVGMGATRLKAGFKQYYGSGLYAYHREQRMQLVRVGYLKAERVFLLIIILLA